MSRLLMDVGVVLAAHRADHPQHEVVRPWFATATAADDGFGVPVTVWASFLRLATNRRVFPVPTPLADAFAFIVATRAQPGHLVLEPGPRHLALLLRLCRGSEATGDLIPDAVLGAIALEHSCTVATLDRDFARFDEVTRVRPEL